MTVVRASTTSPASACAADDDGELWPVETALVDARAARATGVLVHAGVAIAALDRRGPRMKFVDEFRDAALGRAVAGEILSLVEPGRHYKVMEVCGGHTHSIYKYGVDDLLPSNVELVHGPGCPVCVIPMGRVDDGIAVAHEESVIFTCFGDMMRVPGSQRHAARRQGRGRRHPHGLLAARRAADRQARTPTARSCSSRSASRRPRPSTALTLKRARAEGVDELLLHVQPRDDRAAAARAARVARPAARRLHRARPRLDGRRRAARSSSSPPTTASRS